MRELQGFWKGVSRVLVAAWAVIVLYTSIIGAWHPVIQGTIFLGLALSLVFLFFPLNKERMAGNMKGFWPKALFGSPHSPSWLDGMMLAASLVV